jgi:hypothetical protein
MNSSELYNATLQTLQQVSTVYGYAQEQLAKYNINIPSAHQLLSIVNPWVSYIMANSPMVFQQLCGLLDQFQLSDIPFAPILIVLLLLYVVYCTVLASFRWVYYMVTGFIRFSLIVAVLACMLYLAQQKWMDGAAFPGSSTSSEGHSKTHHAA